VGQDEERRESAKLMYGYIQRQGWTGVGFDIFREEGGSRQPEKLDFL